MKTKYILSFVLPFVIGNSGLAVAQNRYPDSYVSNYLKSCMQRSQAEGLPQEQAQSLCSCTISRFQSQYTIEQFKALTEAAKDNPEAAAALTDVGESCFEEILYVE